MTSIVEVEEQLEVSAESLWSSLGEGQHCCWYPVALSEEVRRGQAVGIEFCDGEVVVYRGEDGAVRAVTPYCPHMGANLKVGDVVGNDLRCAFHHWQFGPEGNCTFIPSGDRISESAKIHKFHAEEKWGMIWVFFGAEPLYPLPTFPNWDESRYVTRAFVVPLREPFA